MTRVADILRILGSLHWQDIPQILLQQEKLKDEDDFDEAVSPLLAFTLIQKSAKLEMFSIHQLVSKSAHMNHIPFGYYAPFKWKTGATNYLRFPFPCNDSL